MNRYLKPNGTRIKTDHKNRKQEKSYRNVQVNNRPDKKYILEHTTIGSSGRLQSRSFKFEANTIVKASGNHQYKKKEFFSKGTILRTSAVFIDSTRIPVALLLVQKSRVSDHVLTAVCADEDQRNVLSSIVFEHGRV